MRNKMQVYHATHKSLVSKALLFLNDGMHFKIEFSLGYVWFPENLKENVRERKYKGKTEEKKK